LPCACERAPSADSLREWSPQDHHSTDDERAALQAQAQAQQQPAGRGQPGQAGQEPKTGNDVASLVDLTWRTQCTTCHGAMGRGDGQMGPMLHAPDLTRADWQSKVTDAEMAATIKGGRDKMPKFDLPDPVVQGLVARIRQLGKQ
jgi:cytochrome c oxidase cbb3-type subunit 3